MKPSTTLTLATFILLSILSAVLGWMGRGSWDRRHSLPPQIDTVWRHDTVRLVDTKPAGTVTAKLPAARPEVARDANLLANCDTMLSKSDTVEVHDSVLVDVPIEQRTYEGENYRAIVQGWQPELVSIDIKLPEIAAPPSKRKRWTVTVGPQVGYGFTPAGWQPYAGIGFTAGITF